MKHTLLLVLLAGLALEASAQEGHEKIGPSLRMQLRELAEEPAHDDEARIGMVVHTDDPDALVRAGFPVFSRYPGFVTTRVHPDDIMRLAALPAVRFMDNPVSYPDNDVAAALTGVRSLREGLFGGTEYTGFGVLVCIIDTGIDWRHLDFRDPVDTTKTRILAIWDQTIADQPGDSLPYEFGHDYGVQYMRAQIEAALAGGQQLRTFDTEGHGTHVAGTAAGNGASLSPARHIGMAPDAELVIVKAGNGSFLESNIINGMTYCRAVADSLNRPVVINMSLGSHAGSHDGSMDKEIAASAIGTSPGRVAVFSAGNAGNQNIHISGTTSAGGTSSFAFTVPSYTGPPNNYLFFELWYENLDSAEVRLIKPNGSVAGSATSDILDGWFEAYISYYNAYGPGDVFVNRFGRAYLVLAHRSTGPTSSGTWTLRIKNIGTRNGDFHGWIVVNRFGSDSTATLAGADALYTLSNTPRGALTVASYAHRWRWSSEDGNVYWYGSPDRSDGISSFSSIGPTRDGRMLPHIAAPGQGMISSRSRDVVLASNDSRLMPGGQHLLNQGTSMAAPVVTGAIALLMQQDPTLDYARIVALLQGAADVDAFTGAVPNTRWGAGKLDAFGAMTRLIGNPTAAFQVRSYDGPLTNLNALAPGEALSLRFQHTLGLDGRIRGVLLHPIDIVSSTGTLSFTLHNDDGAGRPGAQIGNSVPLDVTLLHPVTWNYLDIKATSVDLQTNTDYHLVLRPVGTNGNIFIAHDGATTTNRSLKEVGGVWTAQAFDWGVRPLVLSTNAVLPVELVLFEGVLEGETAMLSWITASETNNSGFHVETRDAAEQAAWQEIGFVAGRGTTAEASHYRFATEPLAPGRHAFRLKQVDADGAFTYSDVVELTAGIPHVLALHRDGPNPSPGGVQVRFTVPRSGTVRVEAYDALGRRVGVLFDGDALPGQLYPAALPGDGLAAGLYVVRLVQNGAQQTQAVVLAR